MGIHAESSLRGRKEQAALRPCALAASLLCARLVREDPGDVLHVDAVVLGGNRQAGEPEEPILQLPFPPALLPGLPPPPALPVPPGLASALEEVGTVEVTVLDEQLRVVRGVAGARADVLRVFALDDAGGGALPTW